jgi:hypothetical protein
LADQEQDACGGELSPDSREAKSQVEGSNQSHPEQLATCDDVRDRIIRQRKKAIADLERELTILNARLEMQSKMTNESRASTTTDRRVRRARLVQLVLEQASDLPLRRACAAVGLSRATLYRRMQSNAG